MEKSKFSNLKEFFDSQLYTRQDMKELILRSSLDLLMDCAHNFDEDPVKTEEVAQPLFYLNEILDKVE